MMFLFSSSIYSRPKNILLLFNQLRHYKCRAAAQVVFLKDAQPHFAVGIPCAAAEALPGR
jgi:hypothetical protein